MADITNEGIKTVAVYDCNPGINMFGRFIQGGVQTKLCKLTGTAGSTNNKIPASAFGFSKLIQVSSINSGNKIFPTALADDGDYILIANAENATTSSHTSPVDLELSDALISVTGIV